MGEYSKFISEKDAVYRRRTALSMKTAFVYSVRLTRNLSDLILLRQKSRPVLPRAKTKRD